MGSLALIPARRMAYNRIWRAMRLESGFHLKFGDCPTSLTTIGFCESALRFLHAKRLWKTYKFLVTQNEQPIGVAIIERDLLNGICSIILGLEYKFRGQGLGSKVARMLTRKCFLEFGARRVETSALSTNPASIRMQDGMILEATLKGRFLSAGEPIDEHLYRILRSEWEVRPAERVMGASNAD